VVAGLANLGVAVAKAITGLLSGSAAMLSESAHSFADTTTEVLLFVAVRKGAQPADERHPFGHGRAAFLWALVAAGFTFVAGGGFAITHGVHTIMRGEVDSHVGPSFAVLPSPSCCSRCRWRRACGRRAGRLPAPESVCAVTFVRPPIRRSERWCWRTWRT